MLYLRITSGSDKGKTVPLSEDLLPLSIGRDRENKLPVDDSAVSRRHALITYSNDSYSIKDLNSTNGTFLNGRRIKEDKLRPGDAIRIANINITVEVEQTSFREYSDPLDLTVSVQEPKLIDETAEIGSPIEAIATEGLLENHEVADLSKSHEALQILYRADEVLRDIEDIRVLLANFMDLIMKVIPASRAYVFLLNRDTGMPVLYARRSPEISGEDAEVIVSQTILKATVQQRESILSNDALVDERFIHSRSIAKQKVRSAMCAPLINRGKVLGIIYVDSISQSNLFSRSDLALLSAMAIKAGIAVDNARLYDDLRSLFYNTVETLIRTLQARDPYTSGHSTRVSRYCLLTAEKLGLSTKEKHQLYLASMLHDIGKIGVPDDLLLHPGKLSTEDMEKIREHPALGASMIQMLGEMNPIVPFIRHHHEAYDGSGYPDGLEGEEIPLISRIVATADTYDAMTSDRPYRKRRTPEEAIEELKKAAGTKLDPMIVRAFLEALQELSPKEKPEPAELLTRGSTPQ